MFLVYRCETPLGRKPQARSGWMQTAKQQKLTEPVVRRILYGKAKPKGYTYSRYPNPVFSGKHINYCTMLRTHRTRGMRPICARAATLLIETIAHRSFLIFYNFQHRRHAHALGGGHETRGDPIHRGLGYDTGNARIEASVASVARLAAKVFARLPLTWSSPKYMRRVFPAGPCVEPTSSACPSAPPSPVNYCTRPGSFSCLPSKSGGR